jgi:hypothetical protein
MTSRFFWFFILVSSLYPVQEPATIKKLQSLAAEGKSKEIVEFYKKTPKSFESIPAYNLLGKAQYQLKDIRGAVISCAKSMKLKEGRGTNPCGRLLARIRREFPSRYELHLAEYYTKQHEFKSALVKYYRLVQKGGAEVESRLGLISLFQLLKQPDYVQEQFEMLPKELRHQKTAAWIQKRSMEYKRSYGKLPLEKLPYQDYRIYNMLLLSGTNKEPYFGSLKTHYEGLLTQGYQAKIALRLANLYLMEKDLQRARDVLSELEFRLDDLGDRYTISDRLSHQALRRKLPDQKAASHSSHKKGKRQTSAGKKLFAGESSGEGGKSFSPPQITADQGSAYEPYDFTHLDFATNENLAAFSDLREEFERRLESAKDAYQKRWLFEKVNDRLSMLYLHRVYTHNEPPGSIPIGKYFLGAEGKQFRATLDSLEDSYKQLDQENAKQFEGSLERLEKELEGDSSLESRTKSLKRFYLWWDTQMYRETDLYKRGAFRAYMDTKEGVLLMKKARKAVTRVHDETLY